MNFIIKIAFIVIFFKPSNGTAQMENKECKAILDYKRKVYMRHWECTKNISNTHGCDCDSAEMQEINDLLDSLNYLDYPNKYAKSDRYQNKVIDSNGWHIPDSIGKNTRFSRLKNGQSLDIYYMKPIIVFYDSLWNKNPYNLGAFENFYKRLAYAYDLPLNIVKELAVKGSDMRYIMYRRIKFTKLECYYEIQFYNEIFSSDTNLSMFNWFVSKYKNKQYKGFEPEWKKTYIQNSTLKSYPLSSEGCLTALLDEYSELVCEMERGEVGKKGIGLSKEYLKNPMSDRLWYRDYFFNYTWQIMDFGDGKPVSRKLDVEGDFIYFRNPLNKLYYKAGSLSEFGNDIRFLPHFHSQSKSRRLMYYMIARYPMNVIRAFIDDI